MLQMLVARICNITTLCGVITRQLCNTDSPRGLKKTLEKYYITVSFFTLILQDPQTIFFFSIEKYFFFYQTEVILNEKNLPCHSTSGFTGTAVSYLAWWFSQSLGEKSTVQ